jgi:outer membrane murein-binding lipoprotein Lpp
MKLILIAISVIVLGLLVSACTVSNDPPPMPTYNVDDLNNQIQSLQTQLSQAQSDNQTSSDTIDKLNQQIQQYQSQLDTATVLDNSDWVYPAKIEYSDYRLGLVCTYAIKVHNGQDILRQFHLTTESYNSIDDTYAKTPKDISDWVTYDGYSDYIFSVNGKSSKDVLMQFVMPDGSRFYSITDKGKDYLSDNLTSQQDAIMANFATNITNTTSQISSNSWQNDVNTLVETGLLVSDKHFQFLSVYGEYQPQGNMVTRNAIRWIIDMSEFSK